MLEKVFRFQQLIFVKYDELTSRRFLFVVFEKKDDGECYFKKVKFWSIPNEDLEKVHHVWDRTVEILKNSKNEKGKKLKFPRKSESKVAHVRPHGKIKMIQRSFRMAIV